MARPAASGGRRRRWPFVLLFAAAMLAGVALWAYAPSLPPELLIARYANDKSRFVEVAGVRAHLRDEGNPDGIPMVLIHGSMGSLHMWEGWVGELGKKARLITVDLPGHGLTGAWPRDDYTVDAYADFVEALVDVLNLDRFVLVGHSMGGAVAWTFAATRPDRVSQLILVDAAGYPRAAGDVPLPTRLARLPGIGDIGVYFKPDRLARRSLTEVYGDPAMVTTERVQRYADLQRFPGNREATVQRARTQPPLDPSPLRRLDVPTLILWGAADRWVPVADAFRFHEDIRGSQLEIFDKLGHNPMEEDPRATAAAVTAFLRPIGNRPAPPPTAEPNADPAVHPAIVPEKD
ncbi:MAG: alpha/beta hydrolase [Reyranellaceae bacterium]